MNVTSPKHFVIPGDGTQADNGCLLQESFVPQDNPDNLISKQVDFWLTTVNSAGVIPLLSVVGVPGNVLSAAVFYTQGLRERINLCVFSLALVDIVVLIVTLCLSVEQVYRAFVGPSSFFITYFTAAISTERCVCVVSPLRAQRMLPGWTLRGVLLLASTVLLTGMLVIAGPKHTIVCVYDPLTNVTSDIVYVTQYYKDNKKVLDILDVFIYATALPFIFLVVIVVTTSVTAVKLRSAARWRQQSSSAQPGAPSAAEHRDSREVALTKMLIATSVLFIVCLCPMLLVQVAMFLVPELKFGGRYHNMTSVLWSVISVFRCANSSFNFFVYHHLGSRFRNTLRQIARCRRARIRSGSADPINLSGRQEAFRPDCGKIGVHVVSQHVRE
ncbi:galanin receptor 2a-like [Littorina saxatilis]|uniref:galanin receptor 2a-like n=1 Tax=Littorina saxatilis TaxID=31220 RepID=UPI0038B66EB2